MGLARAPRSLRSIAGRNSIEAKVDGNSGKAVSAVAGLIAAASFSGNADAQQSNLPPVTVDAPVERARPAASKPTPEQVRARNALRRAAQR
ncbi:MAG: TonB-dependent siderophore receptor, partial [Bradyrhizobium sp.]